MLDEFIKGVARARDLQTPTQLHAHLEAAGITITHQAVHQWWTGSTKRFDDRRARELVKTLALTASEIDALRDIQSGLGDADEGRAA